MDRNTIIGLVLIALILIGYSTYQYQTAPKKELKPLTEQAPVVDSLGNSTIDSSLTTASIGDSSTFTATDSATLLNPDSVNAAKLAQRYGSFAPAATGQADSIVLENEDLRIVFSTYGANMESIELKKFKTYAQGPLLLAKPGDQKLVLELSNGISSDKLYYSTTGVQKTAEGQKLVLTATTANGGTVSHVYNLPAKGHLLDYNIVLNKLDKDIASNSNYLIAKWLRRVPQAEKEKEAENRNTRLYYRDTKDGVEYLSETSDEELAPLGEANWISYTQPFFNTTLITTNEIPFDGLKLSSKLSKDNGYLKDYTTELTVAYNRTGTQTYDFQYYIGPNHYQTLKKLDVELEEVINLGSGIMAWVSIFNKYLIIPIFNFLERFIGNYGIIILILTLLIKVALFPLTYKSYLSQAKMKVLKPELDELKERYKDDQGKFAQEQMKLWGKAGVNPLGGCLPTLLQMPILVAMYYFFPSSIELRQEKFLWADDLSTYDSIWNFGFNIPFYGDHVSLFTLLMAVTSIIYAVSNARLTGQQEGPLKYMPYVFPIMLLGIFNSFPAALTYYYFLANVISYGQQWAIQKFFINEEALHKQMQEKKSKPENPNSFSNRMRKAMEQAQKNQEQAKKPNAKKK